MFKRVTADGILMHTRSIRAFGPAERKILITAGPADVCTKYVLMAFLARGGDLTRFIRINIFHLSPNGNSIDVRRFVGHVNSEI